MQELYEGIIATKWLAFLLLIVSFVALFFSIQLALVLVLQSIAMNNFTRT